MQRAVLVLTYEYGFLLREVAQVLEIPLGTAASHLARGKAAVAAHVELIPALEKSSTQALQAPKNSPTQEKDFEEVRYVDNVELAEVIEND
jgi:hypothetical protein